MVVLGCFTNEVDEQPMYGLLAAAMHTKKQYVMLACCLWEFLVTNLHMH